jgi:predicted O-methyltransferase YrrM
LTTSLDSIARSVAARRILEIGTHDGETTLQLAAALPPDGMLITMEANAAVAATARQRFAEAGYGDRISVIVGVPSRFLHKVSGPFDVVFENDASGALHDRLLALLREGGVLITADRKYIKKVTS